MKLKDCGWPGDDCPWATKCATLTCERVEKIASEVLEREFKKVAGSNGDQATEVKDA